MSLIHTPAVRQRQGQRGQIGLIGVCLALLCVGTANARELWNGLSVDESYADVKSSYPNATSVPNPRLTKDGLYPGLGARVTVAGHTCAAIFYFAMSGLRTVAIDLDSKDKRITYDVMDGLVAKYGAPDEHTGSSFIGTYEWAGSPQTPHIVYFRNIGDDLLVFKAYFEPDQSGL